MARSAHPEIVIARATLMVLFFLALGTALNGGLDSPSLSWMIVPVAFAATRYRWQVVVACAVITAVAMLLATIPVDPEGVLGNPERLIANIALLVCVVTITSALMHGELTQRDRAVLDPLTGLLNRSSLGTRTAEIEQQARLSGGALSLVLCDIDRFKSVNDSFGHERGDAVLRDVAYEIRTSLRSFELAYRLGGEEFLVLMPGAELSEAREVAERLRSNVTKSEPGGLHLTMSVGVASASGEALRYEELFRDGRRGPARGRSARAATGWSWPGPARMTRRRRRFRSCPSRRPWPPPRPSPAAPTRGGALGWPRDPAHRRHRNRGLRPSAPADARGRARPLPGARSAAPRRPSGARAARHGRSRGSAVVPECAPGRPHRDPPGRVDPRRAACLDRGAERDGHAASGARGRARRGAPVRVLLGARRRASLAHPVLPGQGPGRAGGGGLAARARWCSLPRSSTRRAIRG